MLFRFRQLFHTHPDEPIPCARRIDRATFILLLFLFHLSHVILDSFDILNSPDILDGLDIVNSLNILNSLNIDLFI